MLALVGGGVGSVALLFLGGTVFAFVVGIIIALVIRHAVWAWLTGPIVALLVSGFLGWQSFREAYAMAPQGGLNIDIAPGLPTLIFLFVVLVYLAFWIGMGTLAGREFREFLNERRKKLLGDGTSGPSSPS